MQFEIINPSAPYTMSAPDLEVAAVALSFLSEGQYQLKGIGDNIGQDVPAFLIGGHDKWFLAKFGASFQDTAERVLNHRNAELAETLNSVTLCVTKASSLNDIGGRARALAQAVQQKVPSKAEVIALR